MTTWDGEGVNFALFSANAEKIELCLFDRSGNREEALAKLSSSEFATNAQLVEKAASVVTGIGAQLVGPQQVRDKLKLVKR